MSTSHTMILPSPPDNTKSKLRSGEKARCQATPECDSHFRSTDCVLAVESIGATAVLSELVNFRSNIRTKGP